MDDKISWPAWYYGPGGAAEIFQREGDVPEGWMDHPSKVAASPAPDPGNPGDADHTSAGTGNPGDLSDAGPKAPDGNPGDANNAGPATADPTALDAGGHAWNADLHVSPPAKTQAGFWQLKPGIPRPAPNPPLDL